MSSAKFTVKVVKSTRPPSVSILLAKYLARCMATTVLPVPAPPSTRAGPLKVLRVSHLWVGCKNTRHFSSGSAMIRRNSSSPSTTWKDWRLPGRLRDSARLRPSGPGAGTGSGAPR